MNEDIDIGKGHRVSIRSWRSLDRFRSTPGNVPPDALEIGKRTRIRLTGFDSASTVFSPSSMSEVSVRPSSAAFFLALRSRSSESLTVVLIGYVKKYFRSINMSIRVLDTVSLRESEVA